MLFKTGIASFLRRLLNRARSPRPKSGERQYPLGLNRDQVDSLAKLVSTPAWPSYSAALQAVCEQEIARIISGLPQDEYQRKCGKVQALLDVLSLPETIDHTARQIDEHSRPADPGTPSAKRDLTFFGTPLWSPSRKPRIYGPNGTDAVDGTG